MPPLQRSSKGRLACCLLRMLSLSARTERESAACGTALPEIAHGLPVSGASEEQRKEMADTETRYLEGLQTKHPDIAGPLGDFATLYQRKLWHPLTVKLEESLALPEFGRDGFLIDLYSHFISRFGHRINLLKLAQFAVRASQQFDEPTQAGARARVCVCVCACVCVRVRVRVRVCLASACHSEQGKQDAHDSGCCAQSRSWRRCSSR